MGWEKLSIAFANSLEITAQQNSEFSFSLVVSIIPISMLVLLCFATFYYGGNAFKIENSKKRKRRKLDFLPR